MFKTLHARLSALLFALLALIGVTIALVLVPSHQAYADEMNQRLNRPLARNLALDLTSKGLLTDDPKVLGATRDEIRELMVINPSIAVYVLDIKGHILANSASQPLHRQSVGLRPIERFVQDPKRSPIRGDDPLHEGQEVVFSAVSLPVKEHPTSHDLRGYLYIILEGENAEDVDRTLSASYILRQTLLGTGVVLLAVLIFGAYLFSFFTRRLRNLSGRIEGFEREELPVQMPPPDHSRDEIDLLSDSFDRMVDRIRRQVQLLERADAQRREIIGNVSHDLRTPLASVRGYLDTLLLKGENLPPTERTTYLKIAQSQTERLGRLVNELFESTKLDSPAAKAEIERFSPAELLQDVAQKFHLAAAERGVTIAPEFDGTVPDVMADIALIERVIDNLLSNALRHAPDGGTIRLRVCSDEAEERVWIEVTDNGPGLRPEDIPHLFDRYYRGGQEESSAGLGLAIVKRIMDLHHTSVEGHNAPDGGATFKFWLRAA